MGGNWMRRVDLRLAVGQCGGVQPRLDKLGLASGNGAGIVSMLGVGMVGFKACRAMSKQNCLCLQIGLGTDEAGLASWWPFWQAGLTRGLHEEMP